ncbi:MAG: hypothetical protein ACP5QR_17880 [Rhizomicrobium sp.]
MTDEAKVDRFRRNLLKATGIAGTAVLAMGLAARPAAAKGGHGSGDSDESGGCFLKGTRIRTAEGYRAIETLSAGEPLAMSVIAQFDGVGSRLFDGLPACASRAL